MPTYIEREAVIALLDEVAKDYADEHTFSTDLAASVVCGLRDNKVATMPAAVVVEHKRGRWVGSGMDGRCSACGNHPLKEMDVDTVYYWSYKPPFCPNCGADMRRDTDGNL